MTKHVIETVTFKLHDGVSRDQFAEAAQQMNTFVTNQPGFVARRLSCAEDGLWIEHIEWQDMAAAEAAASALGKDPANQSALLAIDGSSVAIYHTDLEVAVN